jgi:hypothetical protein
MTKHPSGHDILRLADTHHLDVLMTSTAMLTTAIRKTNLVTEMIVIVAHHIHLLLHTIHPHMNHCDIHLIHDGDIAALV